ncbi:putative histone-lysine N-methyltransferase 1, partial [Melanaphis sacchari]|uniref:putative histone-lysine N-methyltransferase 1 n=1 Tax=Melanaphis sacchari TaxID=742174 RepID=UPI000DC12D8C
WKIGFFEDENKYSVIPSNWTFSTRTGDFCRWPSKQRVTSLMIIKADEPNVDWSSFPVNIIGESYDSYDKAVQKEREIFLSESERSLGRGKRKRKGLKNNNEDTDSDICDSPIKIGHSINPSKKSSKSPSKSILYNQYSNDFNSNCISGEPAAVSNSNINNCSIPYVINTLQNIEGNSQMSESGHMNNPNVYESNSNSHVFSSMPQNQSDNEQINLNETSQQDNFNMSCLNTHSVQDLSNIVNHNIVSDEPVETAEVILLRNIYSYIKRLDGRMDRIEKYLLDSSTMPANKQPLDDSFSIFPINDFQNIINIDEKIKNDEQFEKKMINFISTIGGKNIKNFVKRILQRLFTNELSSKCSWTGFRNNFRLENLKIINIMKEIGRINFSYTDVVFEEHVKEWFRHGNQRFTREKTINISK